jgi:hypothetical protein
MNSTLSLPAVVLTWITDHPYQSAFHAFNGVILCTPAAITVPIFSALGFSAAGPAAGTPIFQFPLSSSFICCSLIEYLLIFYRNGRKRVDELLWRCASHFALRNCSKREYGRLWCQSGRWWGSDRGCGFLNSRLGVGMVVYKRDADLIYEPDTQCKAFSQVSWLALVDDGKSHDVERSDIPMCP